MFNSRRRNNTAKGTFCGIHKIITHIIDMVIGYVHCDCSYYYTVFIYTLCRVYM